MIKDVIYIRSYWLIVVAISNYVVFWQMVDKPLVLT